MKLDVSERLRARRGKQKVRARRPKLARCPVPNCDTLINSPMCAFHWPLVDSELRRRLVVAVGELKLNHGRKPTESILELFNEAITQALYREGAARAKAEAAEGAAAPAAVVIQGAFPSTR